MSAINTTLNNLRAQILKYPVLKQYSELVEEKTSINVEYFVLGFGVLIALLLFSGYGASFVANVVGFAYPAYATLLTLESKNKSDDVEWLMYWVVFGTFSLVENFVEWIVYWIPFYFPVKVTFLLWCMLPQYKGAELVYLQVIKPIFLKHESTIDAALNSADPKAAVESNKNK